MTFFPPLNITANLIVLLIIFLPSKWRIYASQAQAQTLEGTVNAGNFTYYKLFVEGCVLVELDTLKGDSDLYISSSTMTPTWEDYEFKSDTCGYDNVVLESQVVRPVGIGVYGHIHKHNSNFRLNIYLSEKYCFSKYPEYIFENIKPTSNRQLGANTEKARDEQTPASYKDDDEEESMFWVVLTTLLKILFDALIS